MGIEPTRDAAQRPTLDLKSRRATSALSTSARSQRPIENRHLQPIHNKFYYNLFFGPLVQKNSRSSAPLKNLCPNPG